LLKGPVGDRRDFSVDEPFGPSADVPLAGNVRGQVQLTHVNQGVVVRAALRAPVRLQCSRCLDEFEQELDLSFEERFIPTVDVLTGLPLHAIEEDEDEEDVYTIDAHHLLDLHEAVRQQAVMNLPMQPVHDPRCLGLCPTCGANRNERRCACAAEAEADPRLAPLRRLLGDGAG
jgi:uncharacterized protein